MSIKNLRKELTEIQRKAALEKKSSEDLRIKNMTDEELEEEIKLEDNKLLGTDYKTYSDIPPAAHKIMKEFVFNFDHPIIYDPAEGEPVFNDDIVRILVPKNSKDECILYIPDNRLNGLNHSKEN